MVIDTKVPIKETFLWIYCFLRARTQLIAGRLGGREGTGRLAPLSTSLRKAVKEHGSHRMVSIRKPGSLKVRSRYCKNSSQIHIQI